MPIQKQPYKVQYETGEARHVKTFNTKLETLRFIKTILETSNRVIITRVKSVWKNTQHKNIEKR